MLWASVKGPTAALINTAARIGWSSSDGLAFCLHDGTTLDLTRDPPAAVSERVHDGVRQRQLSNIANSMSGQAGNVTVVFEPVRKLLHCTPIVVWTRVHQTSLMSAANG